MNTYDALLRLNSQLPLKARQEQLDDAYRRLHQALLWSLVRDGRALSPDAIIDRLGKGTVADFLKRLGEDDLIVLDAAGETILGAYPVTLEKTPHAIQVLGNAIYAMCALDAVSIAPMFDTDVEIKSRCHVTHTPIHIQMRGDMILHAEPSMELRVGVRWQQPSGAAAHSMCMEMVFLKDESIATQWQAGDTQMVSLFTLPAAVEFGRAFFKPLLMD